MEEMNKHEAKLLCMSRCGLFPCKEDYKFMFKDDLKCRWCKRCKETKKHIIEKCKKCPISKRKVEVDMMYGELEEQTNFVKLMKEYSYILKDRNENY